MTLIEENAKMMCINEYKSEYKIDMKREADLYGEEDKRKRKKEYCTGDDERCRENQFFKKIRKGW